MIDERVLSTTMEAVYGYFRPEEIQQIVSNVLEEIEKLGNGESGIKIGHQGITEDEFIANMNAAIKEGFPYEGDIISHYIYKSAYPLRFTKITSLGWLSVTVYNYHTFMDDRRYIDKYVVSAGIIGPDYGANERKEQYHTFLRRLFVKTGASFMRGGLPNNYYIVTQVSHPYE